MAEAETIIETLITRAFEGVGATVNNYGFTSWCEIPDEWLKENEDIFAYYSHEDELFFLPAYLCYLLRNFRRSSGFICYTHISITLREYSKTKSKPAFKYSITHEQFNAIKAFIKHYRYNLAVNLDKELWDKTLRNWYR